jgi:hypothetical protein
VEEDISSDDDSDNSDEDDDDMFLPTVTSSHHGSKVMMDLSSLSLDQRTFVELRANGLVDSHVLPREPHVIEDCSSSHSSQGEEGVSKEAEAEKEDSIDEVIWNMQVDLSRQHRANNIKTARLQSAATVHLAKLQKDLQIEEENSARIARYTQLLKRQKEAKKAASAKQKNVKKDQDWIPW